MKSLLQKISIALAKRKFRKDRNLAKNRKLSVEANLLKVSLLYKSHDIFFIILSVFSAGFGLKGFLLPTNLLTELKFWPYT